MNKRNNEKKSKKRRQKAKTKQKWRQARASINDFHAKAPYMKAILRQRGCDLPFYDFLDSYKDEFDKVVQLAMSEHHSLLGVYEVDDEVYANPERDWSQFGHGKLQQIFFDIGDEFPDYGNRVEKQANLCGCMSAFLDSTNEMKTLILIRRSVSRTKLASDQKYAFKVAALLHEIGHITDLEQGINFDVHRKRFDVVEAEVYANLYCLERLADRNLSVSFSMLYDALHDATKQPGYMAAVGMGVMERIPDYSLTEWNSFMDAPMTESEAKLIGAAGVRIMGS